MLDSVIAGLSTPYQPYENDISQDELIDEVIYLKAIISANFGDDSSSLFSLLDKITKFKHAEIFPNVCIALRIFCTLPVKAN